MAHGRCAVNFSAGSWVADAALVLAEVRAQNRLPIFTGGSGLYFKALDAWVVGGAADFPLRYAKPCARGSNATASRRCTRN